MKDDGGRKSRREVGGFCFPMVLFERGVGRLADSDSSVGGKSDWKSWFWG